MSGILGIWNLDGQPVERAVLARLSATLAHRGPDGEGLRLQGPVGLVCQLLRVTPESSTETQPLLHPAGTVLVFDGRLDNRDDLLASLKASPGLSAASPDSALVMAAYEVFGDRFPERLNGDFALGLFDPKRQRLLLARDAIGIRPLYYYRSQNLFLFASEIKAILAHPHVSTKPNDEILGECLLSGAPDSRGLTCFAGIFSLLPAHLAILAVQGFQTRQYWDFEPSRETRLQSFQEYAEAFRHYFEQAVRRRLRSAHPVAVSVSGGLDSSSILCQAETLGRHSPGRYPPILGLSYISPEGSASDEKAFLLEIERDYGIAIERVPRGKLGLMTASHEEMWHVEVPFLDEQWNTTHAFLQTTRQRGARVLLTGHWADQVIFPQAYLVDLFRRLAWGQVRSHLKEFGRWLTDADPRCFYRRFFLELVKYHVPPALLPYLRRLRPNHRDRPWYGEKLRQRTRLGLSLQHAMRKAFPTVHARSLYEEARSGYHVMCMEWNNKVASMHGLEKAFPFLDRDLLTFLMGIPGEIQTWKGVPKALLREAMRGVLPDAIVRRTWKADFTDLVNEGLEQDYPQLVHHLESEGAAVRLGYLKAEVMRKEFARLKDRIRGPGCELAWDLGDLLALELWLQVFFGENNHRGTATKRGHAESAMMAHQEA